MFLRAKAQLCRLSLVNAYIVAQNQTRENHLTIFTIFCRGSLTYSRHHFIDLLGTSCNFVCCFSMTSLLCWNCCQSLSNKICSVYHTHFSYNLLCFMSPTSADEEDGSCKQPAAVTSGSLLCRALVGAIDVVLTKPPEQFFAMKAAVINAMKSLLAVSSTAKSAALEGISTLCHSYFIKIVMNVWAL